MKSIIFIFSIAYLVSSCTENQDQIKHTSQEQLQLVSQLDKQIKDNPDSAALRMKLVNALDSVKKYKEAIAQTDSLIKRDSLNNGLWFTKAQLLEDNKDTAAAIESYEKALRIYPSIEAQLSLANLLAENRNPRTLMICRNVSRMGLGRETDADCNFIAGIFYARTGNLKQALELFDKSINDNYTLIEAYLEKGFIYYDSKDFRKAVEVFETATRVNKTYPDAYYWAAKSYEALGNKQEALINYQRALGLDKQLKEAAEAIKRLE